MAIHNRWIPPHPLAAALALVLSTPAIAMAQQGPPAQDPHRQTPHQLDSVVVTASPLHQTAEDLVRPVSVLAGEKLDEDKRSSLGQTLERIPGIQNTSFGPGVGRPVIRGLDGARVQVVNDGMGSGDVSTLSADHAITIEPFLADRIEVIKGPATLLYGSGAIGGAVNVIDGRSPDALRDDPFSGRAELRAGSVNDERTGMFRLDGSTHASGSGLVFHADGLIRDSGNLRIPGYPESAAHLAEEGETPDPDSRGTLPDSAVRTRAGALGVSWIGNRGHIGLSSSLFETRYGVPGHDHEDHDHGHDHGDAEEEHGEEGVHIGMNQRRHELHGGLDDLGIFKTLRFKYARTDYTHTEYEGEAIGTVFENASNDARLELVHRDFAGWRGAFGLQSGRRDFEAIGDEAFIPPTHGRDFGVFWLGQRDLGAVRLELGARHDRNRIQTTSQPLLPARQTDRDFSTNHLSGALRWDVNPALHLRLGVDRAQRAPGAEELYSNGHHVATGNIEVGNDRLEAETANRVELGMGWNAGRVRLAATAYAVRYADYLFLAPLLARDAAGDWVNVTDGGVPVHAWSQADAHFHGLELEGSFTAFESDAGHLDVRLFGDAVRGRLSGGGMAAAELRILHGDHTHLRVGQLAQSGNLPRIAPPRIGGELRWEAPVWRASLGAIRTFDQERTAMGETATPGYTLVDAHFAWHGDTAAGNGWEIFVDGHNLLDEEARPHTSFLKDVAPLAGRGFVGGVRFMF